MKPEQEEKAYKVHSLERGLEMLELLVASSEPMALKDIARKAGFSPSTAHRILNALKHRGYVEQNQSDSKYKPSFKVFELGSRVIQRISIRDEARPILRRLSLETGESAHLNIIDKDQCLCLEKIEGDNAMKVTFLQVGGRIDLYLGAGPKILLAFLPDSEIVRILKSMPLKAVTETTISASDALWREIYEIRKRGYALSFGERTRGAGSIGFPVRDWRGEVVAGISITGYAEHFKDDKLQILISKVGVAAKDLSRLLAAP